MNIVTYSALAAVTFSLLQPLKAVELSGEVNLNDAYNLAANVNFTKNLITHEIPGQLSEPDRGTIYSNGSSGRASYTVDWLSTSYLNGTWYSAVLRAHASSKKIAYQNKLSAVRSISTPQHRVLLKLVQRRTEPGDTDYSGQTVMLRCKVRAQGELSTLATSSLPFPTDDYANVQVSASCWNANISSRWEANKNERFSLDAWGTPFPTTVGQLIPEERSLSARVDVLSTNYSDILSCSATVSASVFTAGFQVLDSSGALIWEYARNLDGSPGDKWVLEIYRSENESTGFTLSMEEPLPFAAVRHDTNGDLLVDFYGKLEASDDLTKWSPVDNLISPYRIPYPLPSRGFFRAHPQ
jgi:hypothetical protein